MKEVTIQFEGEEHKLTVSPEETILDAALDAGLELPHSCQKGNCTVCAGTLLSGEVIMDRDKGLTEEDKKDNIILVCQSHPITDNVNIEVD